jgi:hypothetical protein
MKQMPVLNMPEYKFSLKNEKGKIQIFDLLRKKYITLTPEEWVRQNFIAWLINELQYPAGLIAIEKEVVVNTLKRRYDIVVHNREGAPVMLVECKSPKVKISESVFSQIARYNLELKVNYLVVTNGMNHYCCKINFEDAAFEFLQEVPSYEEICCSQQ